MESTSDLLSQLKKIASKLDLYRDSATERLFIKTVDTISQQNKEIDNFTLVSDVTKLLCDSCGTFQLLGDLLNPWLSFLTKVPSQTKYTIFLVEDIDEFRPLAKRFFDPRFVHLKNRILEVLISYLEDNKPKTTDWLKQLFKISECGHTDMPSYEKLNLKNYCRRMIPIIDKHTPLQHRGRPILSHSSTDEENAPLTVEEPPQVMVETTKRKRKSAQIAVNRTKMLLENQYIDTDKSNSIDVYDFDWHDEGPSKKKKCRVTQPKKRKKPEPFPRIKVEQKQEMKRAKVYTIQVKTPVGSQTKKTTLKLSESTNDSHNPMNGNNKLTNDGHKSKNATESRPNESEFPMNLDLDLELPFTTPESPVEVSEINTKTSNVITSTPNKPTSFEKIMANIDKINEAVSSGSSGHSNVVKTTRRRQSNRRNAATVTSSKKPETNKKPKPRKLYTEPDPELDGMDMEQADQARSDTKQRTLAKTTSAALINSIDLNDEVITETSSYEINVTSSHTSFVNGQTVRSSTQENSMVTSVFTKNPSNHATNMVPSAGMEVETNETGCGCKLCPNQAVLVQQLKTAANALCCILRLLDPSTRDCQHQIPSGLQQLM